MVVKVNGDERTLDEDATVLDLLAAMGIEPSPRGLAIAVNGELAPRAEWGEQRLADGDSVEVLRPMQGG